MNLAPPAGQREPMNDEADATVKAGAVVAKWPTELAQQLPDLGTLKAQIMQELEAKLAQKEDSLWRRGQVEIKRLQFEQQQVKIAVEKLQEKQTALTVDTQKIRCALIEVTDKFERVVLDMREVLRALPQAQQQRFAEVTASVASTVARRTAASPSPSVASTSASDAIRGSDLARWEPRSGGSSSACTDAALAGSVAPSSAERGGICDRRRQCRTPASALRREVESVVDEEESLPDIKKPCCSPDGKPTAQNAYKTFCTPPRATGGGGACGGSEDPMPGLSLTPSPAVLSLASVLPSSATPRQPSPGCKRVLLAQCLDQNEPELADGKDAEPATPPGRRMEQFMTPVGTGPSASPALQQPMGSDNDVVTVEVLKEPGFSTLGIEVNQIDEESLRVEGIDEHGLVARHNMRQEHEANRIWKGDRIIEVNSVRHDPTRMLHECKVKQRLVFVLRRGFADDVGADEGSPLPRRVMPEAHSPMPGRLRPDAQVFVPSSSQKEMRGPPGLDMYEDVQLHSMIPQVPSLTSAATSTEPAQTMPAVTPASPEPTTHGASPLSPQLDGAGGGEAVKRMLFPP
mmetsp:Transcript_75948/g.210879  ORF Transcript_75948/g.210879 Transcript_75948/m.210879 type:complete len:574 (+) Transcript_75948:59-1780(+)